MNGRRDLFSVGSVVAFICFLCFFDLFRKCFVRRFGVTLICQVGQIFNKIQNFVAVFHRGKERLPDIRITEFCEESVIEFPTVGVFSQKIALDCNVAVFVGKSVNRKERFVFGVDLSVSRRSEEQFQSRIAL